MSSLARPFELANSTDNGMTNSEQSTSYAAQNRNLVNADFGPHLSVDRSRSSYNAFGFRQLASGTPLCPPNDAPAAAMHDANVADLPRQILPYTFRIEKRGAKELGLFIRHG